MSPLPALALLVFASAVQAADLKVLSGNGARAAVLELAARFDRASGHKTTVEFAVNPETRKKIESGQPFDVAVMNPPQLDALIKQNLIAAETRAVLGRAGIGVGIREGAPKPDITTSEAFKTTLLKAKSLVYVDPAQGATSGVHFKSVLERLGIADAVKGKTQLVSGGYPAEMTETLETRRFSDFDGTFGKAFSAHPHLDPDTGEMNAICYAGGEANTIWHTVLGTDGKIRRNEPIEVQNGPSIHDCMITKNYVIVMDLPVTFSMNAPIRLTVLILARLWSAASAKAASGRNTARSDSSARRISRTAPAIRK